MWKDNRRFDHRQIYKPRNLHIKDMVFGGLVGNEQDGQKNDYTITWKADGVHRLLIIFNNRIWLIQPPGHADLIYVNDANNTSNIDGLFKYNLCLMDNYKTAKLGGG